MSVTTAALLTYAQDLVCDGADGTSLATIIAQLYEDELPANDFGANMVLTTAVAGTATYTVSTSLRKLYALCFGGKELSHETLGALDSLGPTWRDAIGEPIAYTEQLQEDRTLRVYPAPDRASAGPISVVTEIDRFLVIGTTTMSAIPDYLRLPAALWVLAREYERESDHRDVPFAKLCRALAEKLFLLAEGV